MTHPITLDIPDEVFQPLLRLAQQKGETVEAVASACLAESVTPRLEIRLRRWKGVASSNVPDASLRHDDYLGQAIADGMQGKTDD